MADDKTRVGGPDRRVAGCQHYEVQYSRLSTMMISRCFGRQKREDLMQVGADLQVAWSHPNATMVTR